MYVDSQKQRYFQQNGVPWLNPSEAWKREYALCNCSQCIDYDCTARNKDTRFPLDAGGKMQCLRLAQDGGRIAFRNVDGTVIVLPDELTELIKACK